MEERGAYSVVNVSAVRTPHAAGKHIFGKVVHDFNRPNLSRSRAVRYSLPRKLQVARGVFFDFCGVVTRAFRFAFELKTVAARDEAAEKGERQ